MHKFKYKSHSHKEENSFKFETFNTKLKKINITSLNNLKRKLIEVNIGDDEDKTFFFTTLEKWIDLNCTNDFRQFRHKIGPSIDIQSLPQLIHKKKFLIEILLDNLKVENQALDAILELIISLSRDLQSEFYEYFPIIFERLVILSVKNVSPEIIENVFVCQTFLFKYLCKFIIEDIDKHFEVFKMALTSHKDYVVNFTSETFAFLIKKSKDPKRIFQMLFLNIETDGNLSQAVGRILFETIKGINGKLHNNSDLFLQIFFEQLVSDEKSLNVIKDFIQICLENLDSESFASIWKYISIDSDPKHQNKIELIHQIVQYKNCKYVHDSFNLTSNCIEFLCKQIESDEEMVKKLLKIIEKIFMFKYENLPSDKIIPLCEKVFNLENQNLSLEKILNFATNIISSPLYDKIIYKNINKLFVEVLSNEPLSSKNPVENDTLEVLRFMTNVVREKAPRPLFGGDIQNLKKYLLDFEHCNQTIIDKICSLISAKSDFEIIYHCLIILSNVSVVNLSLDFIKVLIDDLDFHLSKSCDNSNIPAKVFLEIINLLILQKSNYKSIIEIDIEILIKYLIPNPFCLELLQALDFFLSCNRSKLKEFQEKLHLNNNFTELYPILEMNLASPYRMNRILASHILSLFNWKLKSQENNENNLEELTIFQIFLQAELLPVDLENYRERLRLLRKLDFNFLPSHLPDPINGISFDMAPIYFLLGNLYENLSLLWQPILEVLETYSHCEDIKDQNRFMEVLFNHFKQTLSLIKFDHHQQNAELFSCNFNNLGSKPDHINHRLLILKSFKNFPSLVERRNKDFVELFFNFLTEEFKSKYVCRENISITKNDDSKMNADDNNSNNNEPKSKNKRTSWLTFFAYLEVFEMFKNPRAAYREAELKELFTNLLSSPNSLAQKHAFNCLLAYNHSYLIRYKENFLKLIDDKSFSSEIHSFMIRDNNEDNIIAVEDRPNVVQPFFRILMGKLIGSSGTKTHGKSKTDFIRSLIFKVLSSFGDNEQILFLKLIYSSLNVEDFWSNSENCEKVADLINLESFIPIKQFQSFITTLEFSLKHFGNTSISVMQYMFKVLLTCSKICSYLLSSECRSKIKTYIVEILKTFRTNCFKVAEYFFTNFQTYPFTSNEINFLFQSMIRPLIKNVHVESLTRPSPLLKLFGVWTENSKYFILLVKRINDPEDNDRTPIDSIIKLYSNSKISATTYEFITKLIENLLIAESKESDNEIPINENNYLIPSLNHDSDLLKSQINFGTLILIPYLKDIIERIKLNNLIKPNNKYFTLQEINILARLSVYVTDPDDSKTIMILLLNSISRKKRPEEDKEIFILKILTHLSNNISEENFTEILDSTFDLFTLVERPLPRRQLCNFLLNLAKKKEKFQNMAKLINDLNSYNQRYPEEPDYDIRISAFKEIISIFETLRSNSENFPQDQQLEFIRLLLLNCSFFMNFYDDLSIRELSTKTIIQTCLLFENSSTDLFNKYVIDLVLFQIISKGIGNAKESTSNEFINCLIEVIKNFPSKNIYIDQLLSLCNNDDEEMDFWQNIKHIQLHRRTRALNRLMLNKDIQLASISSRVYMHFLIPIVKNFIVQSSQPPNNNLTLFQASVDCLATFLQYCPWQKYDKILSYYINALLNNKIDAKIAIRIISALLEKFSFLKPEQVLLIEKNFIEDDFDKIKAEYSFGYSTSGKNFKKKKQKRISKSTNLSNDDDEPETSIKLESELKADETKEEVFSEQDLRHYQNIYNSLCKKLLPLMHRCLHQRSEIDNVHDSNKSDFSEDEDIQRIPIAIAIVKLLKHVQLDQRLFQININSIVLRICQFLQSKAYSIREMARKTLAQILEILGPKYFPQIFNEMKVLLDRGYRRHVLIYTTFVLLQRLLPQFKGGDLDSCIFDLIEVCHLELFGSLAEEKEVSQIISKTQEAKKLKSYDIYELIARFVSESLMKKVINPLESIMNENSDSKTLQKIEKAFHKIGCGLVQNKDISVGCLTQFLNEIFAKTVPKESDNNSKHDNDDDNEQMLMKIPRKMDSFIIPPKSLRRVNPVSKVNRLSYSYILSNFALECYLYILKTNKSLQMEMHQDILNLTLEYLEKFLKSNDLNVVTTALNCILLLLNKYSALVSFENHSNSIISQIFLLLQKHSGLNNENNRLTTLCFKTIAYFINTRLECKLADEQIAILLSYAENDIENNNANVSVYFLLKSIIARKFISKELHLLMEKLMDLAITTEIDSVRDHSIDLYVKYIIDYPIDSNRLKGKLLRLARQLEVKWLAGRKAAIIMLKSIIKNLSYDVIAPVKNHLFLIMSSALVNEDSTECANGLDEAILKLMSKLSQEDLDELFENFVLSWLKSDTITIKTMCSNLLILFVEHEKLNFEKRIPHCLGLISEQLDPSKLKSLSPTFKIGNNTKDEDNLLFSHLNFILKLLKMENILQTMSKKKLKKYFDDIFNNIVSSFLIHPHTWIRNVCAEIFGTLFSLYDPQLFSHHQKTPNNFANHFLFENGEEKMVQLARKFCLIYRDIYSCHFMSEQLIKNLVYIARVFIVLDNDDDWCTKEKTINNEESSKTTYSLEWLIKKMIFETKFEIQFKPKETLKRIIFIKWTAAVSFKLGPEKILKYLPLFMPTICREDLSNLNDNNINNNSNSEEDKLRNLTKQFIQMIRNMIGSEKFIDLYNDVRNQLSHKRLERKKHRAVQMVNNMVAGVKRKQAKHKRSQKKPRKMTVKSQLTNNFTISSL